jgi:hypothetical protein
MLLKVYVLYGMYRCKKSSLNVLFLGFFCHFFYLIFSKSGDAWLDLQI